MGRAHNQAIDINDKNLGDERLTTEQVSKHGLPGDVEQGKHKKH
jgi:hypothetical protein